MFDGKVPRTTRRRPVHLGGRSTATTARNRQDILQQTKKLRQERQAQQRQTKAATLLQTCYRGHFQRRHLQQDLYQALVGSTLTQQPQSVPPPQAAANAVTVTTQQLNVWLRLMVGLSVRRNHRKTNNTTTTIVEMLRRYALQLPAEPQHQQQPQYAKYIWQQTLKGLLVSPSSSLDAATAQRILVHTLPPPLATMTNTSIMALPLGVDLDSIMLLCETTVRVATNEEQEHPLSSFLWTYLQQILPRQQQEDQALLGVMQWMMMEHEDEDNNNDHLMKDDNSEENNRSMLALVQALLDQDNSPKNNKNPLDTVAIQLFSKDPHNWLRLLSSVLHYHKTLPAWQVVPLVERVWQAFPQLLQATILLARKGPNALDELVLQEQEDKKKRITTQMDVDGVIVIDDEEEDDDDSDSDDNQHVVGKTAAAVATTTTTTRMAVPSSAALRVTKQDILTAPKLERLFHETRDAYETNQMPQLMATLRSSLSTSPSSQPRSWLLSQLAAHLAQPQLWQDWAQVLLTTHATHEYDASQVRARHSWVHCLCLLLQGCRSGLYPRTSASSPFLTQLAFSSSSSGSGQKSLVEHLWRYVMVQDVNANRGSSSNPDPTQQAAAVHALQTWSLFCDVFGQQLIALRDDQFLQQHTVSQEAALAFHNNNNQPEVIEVLAEHVISRLKDRLYELYWGQPVLSQETKALLTASASAVSDNDWSAARVRLFLTGTKLWNSLYERWCRLVRVSPFCDESTWLFPTLTSLTFGDGIVRGTSAASSDDPMDVDEDDSDSEDDDEDMTDGNNNQQRDSTQQHDAETEALAGAFQDPKMARILTSIPQCMPFERRVKLFDTLLQIDKVRTQDERAEMQATLQAMMRGEEFEGRSQVHVEIRRDALYTDSMLQLNQLGPKLKKKVKVAFINQHGAAEAGIDGGGVFKEFLDDLIKEAFTPPPSPAAAAASSASTSWSDPKCLQLFAVTPLETLMVNPAHASDPKYLSHFEFLGRAVGKAVYESILVEPQFCLPFLNSLLGKSNTLEDLKNYDPDYYKSLIKLQALSRQDLQGAELTFEAHLGHNSGQTVELVPGGAQKPVTKDNVIPYAHMVSHRLLNVQSAAPVKAFLRGFRDLIPSSWVRLFAAHELQKLISGDDIVAGVDVAAFKACMSYSAGYHPSQPFIEQFWEIVNELSPADQRKLLKFWTSCSRQPLLGFGSLDPKPCIQQVRLPDELFTTESSSASVSPEDTIAKQMPLPTAATCMNLLKLPNYRNKELMRRKLLQAIESGAGFELT